MDPLDPNRSFVAQFTEPDPTYIAPRAPIPSFAPQQLFASEHSNHVVDQLVAPADYLQNQRATLAQRINSARLENTFAPPSAQGYQQTVPVIPVSPSTIPSLSQRYSYEIFMDKRHPSSFQQLEKVCCPSGCQCPYAYSPTAGRRYLCNCMPPTPHGISLCSL